MIDRRRRKAETIDEMVAEIHIQLKGAQESEWKVNSCRIYAGQLLLSLRERIENGEEGEGVNWWEWYGKKFTRSRRDADRVMALARSEDPEAALEEERETRNKIERETRTGLNLVDKAIKLVRRMTMQEREQFVARMETEL